MSTTRGRHLIGRVIGSCVIEQQLGYGGSSAVFLAQQREPDEKVAIKVFLPRSNMDIQMQRDFYRRFLREAAAASKLNHPNILPIYSYGEQDGLPYIIMPYIPCGTLSEYLHRHGPLSLNEAQVYLEQIASALDYAHHEHGCVHCDVKPANILLDSDGSAVLTDFGIVHMMRDDGVAAQLGKHAEILMGTPDYISPEQALGQPLDGRSDVYSLGITLFHLLAGRLPFHAESSIAIGLLHVHEPPPSLSLIRADITPYIDHVILKALAKKPADRFQTAGEFSTAFAEAIQSSDVLYQIALNHRRAQLADEDLHILSSHTQRALREVREARPVVRVKPTIQSGFGLSRMLVAIMILLAVTVGAALTSSLIALHLTGHATGSNIPPVHITVPSNTHEDELSDDENWPTGGAFFFADNQYHIQNNLARNVALALYADHEYSNFQLSVTMREVRGKADGGNYYGVAFRSTASQSHYYLFEIACWDGGQYQFLRYDGDGRWKSLAYGSAHSLACSSGKSNILVINAMGSTFHFFINGKPIGPAIIDTSKAALTNGEIGFTVEEQGAEIAFSHLYIEDSK
jgi:serine/threonine protein kinase